VKNGALISSSAERKDSWRKKRSVNVFKILAHNLFSREYKSFHFRASHDGKV